MSERLIVVIHPTLSEEQREEILAAADGHRVEFPRSADEAAPLVSGADAVAGQVESDLLEASPRLTWVHSWAAGPVITEGMRSPRITVTSSKGNGAIPLAEHAVLLMLLLNRQADRWFRAQEDHRWERFTHGELAGKTCGIIGLGNAGRDLALKAKAFHMQVNGMRRDHAAGSVDGVDRLFPVSELHDFLEASDYVVVTAPYTAQTAGMLDEAAFRSIGEDGYFICISRGGIADDAALEKALREGWIAGAGLDAHAIEPLPEDSPFWDMPNTVVTPHNGATTAETAERGVAIFVDNLQRFVADEPLVNLVDKDAGY